MVNKSKTKCYNELDHFTNSLLNQSRGNCTGRSPLNDSNIRSQRPEKRIPPKEKLRTLSTTQQKKDKKNTGKSKKKTKQRQFFNTLGTPLYISKMTTIEKKMATNCPKTIEKKRQEKHREKQKKRQKKTIFLTA